MFGIYGEGLDWKRWEHGNCDLCLASARQSVCIQLSDTISIPGNQILFSEADQWCYYCLFETIPSLTAQCAFWVQLQSFISFLSWHMLTHPWFLVPALAWLSYSCLSSACSTLKGIINSIYKFSVFLYVNQFLILLLLGIYDLPNDPESTCNHIARWRESKKLMLKSLIVTTCSTIIRYYDVIYQQCKNRKELLTFISRNKL